MTAGARAAIAAANGGRSRRRSTSSGVPRTGSVSWLSAVALQGALDLISEAGGGVVEGYPHDTQGKKKSVLYNGTRTLFERAGFTFVRGKGTGNCVMRRTVP